MADAQKELQIVISAKDEASASLKSFSAKLNDLSDNLVKSGALLTSIGVATGFAAKGFVDAAGKMEATRTAFKTLIGNSQLAEKTLKDLFTLEAQTPFTLDQVLTESKKLLAMGTDAKDLTKTLTMLGDVAAGVGFEKLPQLTLAFGQIQAKGRLMGTELRQLTEAGFNLAEAMGVSSQELDQMISKGEVGFEDVRVAFEKVTSEGGRFNNLMDELSKTTPGRLSTLESSVFKLQVALGTALLPTLNKIIDALIPALTAFGQFAAEHETLTTIIVAAGLALGALGIAMVAIGAIIPGVIATVTLLTGAVGLLGGGITTVITIIGSIVAVLGGPLTIAIVAIMALIALLTVAWTKNWFDIQGKTKAVIEWVRDWVVPVIVTAFNYIKETLKVFVDFLKTYVWPAVQLVFNLVAAIVKEVAQQWVDRFNIIKGAVEGVIGAIKGMISAAQEMANKVKGGLKIPGFQHGGFVDGPVSQAMPAMLHGGERVIPRNGVDVNSGGGGGVSVSINFSGAVSMDSESRVQELANKIISILGRQSELASKGVGF